MQKKNMKGFIMGVVLTLIMVSSVNVVASSIKKSLEVVYDNIKLVVDGNSVELGKENEPFIYNGTTYLPVRAVGESLGKSVDWDGKTKTVYIGKKNQNDEEAVYLGNGIEYMNYQKSSNANSSEFYNYYYDKDVVVEDNMGNKYNNYLTLGMYNSWGNSFQNSWSYLDFPTNGEYKKFKAKLAWPSEMKNNTRAAEVSIYADDKLIYEHVMNPGDFPKDIDLDIKGALKVRIKVGVPEHTTNTYLRFHDPRFIK